MTTPLFATSRNLEATGPLVVLVHGTMDRSTAFARVMAALDGVACLAYDRRGYGRSAGAGPPAVTVDEGVDDLLDVVEATAPGRDLVPVGHSFGGHVALRAAQRCADRVRAAVVYETPMAWMPWYPATTAGADAVTAGGSAAAAESFMRRMVGDARWEALPPRTRARRLAEGPALLADMAAIRGGAAPFDPAAVAAPVVVGHGSRAAPHQVRGAEWLVESLPRAELHVVAGATHGAHTSHPADFALLVRRALGGVRDRGAG